MDITELKDAIQEHGKALDAKMAEYNSELAKSTGQVRTELTGEIEKLAEQYKSLRNEITDVAQRQQAMPQDLPSAKSYGLQFIESDAFKSIAGGQREKVRLELKNTNINSDTSEEYTRRFGDAGTQAANAVRNSYRRQAIPAGWTEWAGKGATEDRKLASNNRAASVNLSGPQRRPEGATLRRWEQ